MTQTITIDPVTRLEGHGKITIHLNGQGEVEDAQFHVTQVRGFEKFSEGRPFYEMPSLMARICGICPVSHLLASAKACEAIMSVRIPHTAAQLRRMLNMAQMVQSHALSFFHLSSPDLLLGMESDPTKRHIFGVAAARPELGRAGIGLRRFGQHIIELLGNKRIHPGWVVPGGVTEPLTMAKRDEILAMLPEAYANVQAGADRLQANRRPLPAGDRGLRQLPIQLPGPDQRRRVHRVHRWRAAPDRSQGNIIEDGIDANRFTQVIGEAVEDYTYTKFVYYKPLGYPEGSYRVGPLGPPQHRQVHGHAASRQGTGRVQAVGQGTGRELLPLPSRAPRRGPLRHREDRAHPRRSAHSRQARARHRRRQPPRGRGPDRSSARHALAPLQGGRERQDHLGQPGGRHRP